MVKCFWTENPKRDDDALLFVLAKAMKSAMAAGWVTEEGKYVGRKKEEGSKNGKKIIVGIMIYGDFEWWGWNPAGLFEEMMWKSLTCSHETSNL